MNDLRPNPRPDDEEKAAGMAHAIRSAERSTERVILSELLNNGEKLVAEVADTLTVKHFTDPGHQALWEAIQASYLVEDPVNMLAIAPKLLDAASREKLPPHELADIATYSPLGNRSNWDWHLDRLLDAHAKRRILEAASGIAEQLHDPKAERTSLLMDGFEHSLHEVREELAGQSARGEKGLVTSREWMAEVNDALMARYEGNDNVMPTGFADLDKLLDGGLRPKSLCLVGARPSIGKTTFCLNVAWKVASKGHPVAIVSLETPRAGIGLGERLVSCVAEVDFSAIRNPRTLNEMQLAKLQHAQKRIADAPLYIDHVGELTTTKLALKIRDWVQRLGVKLVMIDYLQLIEPVTKRGKDSEYGAVTEVVRKLKQLSQDYPVCFLAVCTLARTARTETAKPTLADLKSTGDLEYAASEAVLLNESAEEGEEHIIEGNLAKQKDGTRGNFRLMFRRPLFRFENAAHETVTVP